MYFSMNGVPPDSGGFASPKDHDWMIAISIIFWTYHPPSVHGHAMTHPCTLLTESQLVQTGCSERPTRYVRIASLQAGPSQLDNVINATKACHDLVHPCSLERQGLEMLE